MSERQQRQSIWQKEIDLFSESGLFARQADLSRWPAAVGVGLLLTIPALMAVLAMIHRQIDYTALKHPELIQNWAWPLAMLAFAVAFLLAAGQAKYRGVRLSRIAGKNPVLLLFGLAVLWMLVSQCVNGWDYAFWCYTVPAREETFFMHLSYLLLMFPGAALVRSKKPKTILLRAHLIVSLLLVIAAFVLWHSQTESSFFYDWTPRFSSIYTNPNYYGYYLSVTIPLAAASFVAEEHPLWKGLCVLSLAANSAALSINDTMGAWVACWAAMAFLLVTHGIVERRLNRQALAAVLLFAVCLYLPGHILGSFEKNTAQLVNDVTMIITQAEGAGKAGSGRWRIWRETLRLIQQNPAFGIGFEGIAFRGLKEVVGNVRPHNEFMQYALFYGIPTSLFYFAGCLGVFIRALRKKASLDSATLVCLTGAFGYLVSSFFGNTLYCTAPFLFLFLGMGYVHDDDGV